MREDLRRSYERARDAWPGVDVTFDDFQRCCSEATVDPQERYIAFACARGDGAAIAAFERRYFTHVDVALARLKVPDDARSEVKQILRHRLFLSADGASPSKILGYAGRGELEGLVRVAAVRAAIDHLRATGRFVDDQALSDVASPESDLELRVMRSIDAEHFKAAFRAALEALGERDRTLLRLQLVDGLNVDEIGAAYGVHRATAARWLARTRELVASTTKQHLADRLKLGADEIDELVRSVQSRLELTISRLLRER